MSLDNLFGYKDPIIDSNENVIVSCLDKTDIYYQIILSNDCIQSGGRYYLDIIAKIPTKTLFISHIRSEKITGFIFQGDILLHNNGIIYESNLMDSIKNYLKNKLQLTDGDKYIFGTNFKL